MLPDFLLKNPELEHQTLTPPLTSRCLRMECEYVHTIDFCENCSSAEEAKKGIKTFYAIDRGGMAADGRIKCGCCGQSLKKQKCPECGCVIEGTRVHFSGYVNPRLDFAGNIIYLSVVGGVFYFVFKVIPDWFESWWPF
jgi:hypothetical protein